jgi:hypothetical protein
MTVKLTEEKYKKLKKEVAKNRQLISLDGLNIKDKEKKVSEHADSLIFDNDEEKQFYIANFLIPDDRVFYEAYIENGKNLKKCADEFAVSSSVVLARVFEMGKYQEYMAKMVNEKGEKIMSEVEIIGAFSSSEKVDSKSEVVPDKHVDDDTVKAINRINKLFEDNIRQEEKIANQNKVIEKQTDNINSLESSIKEKDILIVEFKETIKKREDEIKENERVIRELESEIEEYRKTIKDLTPYRDNYKKIIGFLDKNIIKEEN